MAEKETVGMTAEESSFSWKIFVIVGITTFGAETLIMILLSAGGLDERLTTPAEAVLDGALLLLLIFPVFHFSLFRPMRLKIAALREAREDVRLANRELALVIEKNERILAAAEEGILGLDREGMSGVELVDKNHHDLIHHFFCEGNVLSGPCPLRKCLSTGRTFQVEERLRKKDGAVFPAELSCAPMKDEEVIIGAVLTFRDISERKKHEQNLKDMAYFDVLTGLPNRPLLQDRFGRLVADAQRSDKLPAIMFIDLDDFKEINDRYGHATGDAYLKEIGRRTRDAIRDTDTLARVGGDEFVWAGLIRGTDEAMLVAKKILGALSSPIPVEGENLQVSASIGIAFHRRHGMQFEELLKAADEAMYRAKEQGKNSFFFSGQHGEEQNRCRKQNEKRQVYRKKPKARSAANR